ncbi:MAG: LacI family transcriptional regulator [Lachnospiraceae bacterium]|nr:LacI family transcriptional regulator [Lachnospiraceae bacterium]
MGVKETLTIYDIAKLSGVSPSTVSRVINNSGYVGPEKREKVLKVIEEHEFRPNALAQGLSTRHSQTIGMLVPDVINPFYATTFVTLEKEAQKYGYNVILCNYSNDNDTTMRQIEILRQKQADVILQVGGPTDLYEVPEEYVAQMKKISEQIPLFTNGGSLGGIFHSIMVDDSKAIEEMLKYAYSNGHRRFAMIGGSSRYIPSKSKQEAFTKTLTELGVPEKFRIVLDYDNFDQFGGKSCVELIADQYQDAFPTLFVGINESVAIGALKELLKRGNSVPYDVSVVGFDNTYLSSFSMPELTSIGCDYEEYARVMMEAILKVIAGEKIEREVLVESKFERKASLGPAVGI